jgi:uncharacterized protein YciI
MPDQTRPDATPADPAVRLENVWAVEGTYAPDAMELRRPFRTEHLDRLARLRDEGILILTGAFLDGSSSLTILRAPSEEAALDLMRQDVYIRQGVWVELRARAFGRLRDDG